MKLYYVLKKLLRVNLIQVFLSLLKNLEETFGHYGFVYGTDYGDGFISSQNASSCTHLQSF